MIGRAGAAGLALALSAQASAQTAVPDEIVVIGTGLAPPPGEAAYGIVVIDRERLTGTASGRLEDALRDVAGIAQFRRSDSGSAHPTSQGVTLRGLGGNASSRTLLLLDGVPQADPFGGWMPFSAYAPERLASARITRGGGSGYQGPGALAGTIELRSAGPDQLGLLHLAAAYGSRDSIDAAAVGATDLGSGFVAYAADYRRSDGFVPVVAEDRGRADRPAPYEQASIALRAVAPLGGATELQASLSGFTDRRDRGADFTPVESGGVDASVRLIGRGVWRWSALAYLQHRAFASGFSTVTAGRAASLPSLDQYHVPATGIGGRIELQPSLGAAATLRVGADVRHVEGRTQERFGFSGTPRLPASYRIAGGANLTLGAFADWSLELDRWTLSAGGRLDHWSIHDGTLLEALVSGGAPSTDQRFAARNGEEATGRIGAAWRTTDTLAFRAAAYRGWRLPTLNELYRPFRVGADLTVANSQLAPERLWGAELGLDLTPARSLTVRGTLFWNRLDDAIANVTDPVLGANTRQRRNLSAVKARGAELDLAWSYGPLGLSASWAYTDARVDAPGTPLHRLRPAQTAAHQGSATLSWREAGHLGGALTARYVDPQFEDDLNQRTLDDAMTVDAQITLPLTSSITVEARAENLFDTRVEAGISGADIVERATPRTLWIGVNARL